MFLTDIRKFSCISLSLISRPWKISNHNLLKIKNKKDTTHGRLNISMIFFPINLHTLYNDDEDINGGSIISIIDSENRSHLESFVNNIIYLMAGAQIIVT